MEISPELTKAFEEALDIVDKPTKKIITKIKRVKDPVKAFEILLELDGYIIEMDNQTLLYDEYYRAIMELMEGDYYFAESIGQSYRYGINSNGNDLVHLMCCFCTDDLIIEFFDFFDSNNVNIAVGGYDEEGENAIGAAKRLNRDKVVEILLKHGAFLNT